MTGTVGDYEILDKLGEGGTGVVDKPRDALINRTAALNFLTAAGADQREIQLLEAAGQTKTVLKHAEFQLQSNVRLAERRAATAR